ncbi:MAG: VWA domain-containing protein [Pyrobaculum sp.]
MGLLLNVDYSDPLVRARALRALRASGVKSVGIEEAAEAYYVHYRSPIFGGRSSSPVWERFLTTYVKSHYYRAVAGVCRLNHKASLEAAARLLRAFESYLKSLENYGRAWFGRGAREAWAEAMRQIRRHMGDPADVAELHRVFKKLGEILGRGRSGDPASLALSVATDPRRVRLARVLARALELAPRMGLLFDGRGRPGFIEWERAYGSLSRIGRAALYAKALSVGAPLLFLHKAAWAEIPVYRARGGGDKGVYLLIDKSGSMYGAVKGVEKIAVAAAYAIAALRRFKNVVVRFFDAEVYEPISDVEKLVDVLTRVVASGGTDITKAVEAATEDAKSRRLEGYTLAVVTDGEDDKLNPVVLKEARAVFKEVWFVLIGDSKPPPYVRVARLFLGEDRPGVNAVEGPPRAV